MMKHMKKIILLLLAAVLAVLAAAPIRFVKADARNWMENLEDDRSINTLTIPGTHDSGALYSFADLFGKCQTLPISQQFDIGVRFLDLRLRLVDDELRVYHNFVEQKTDFNDLLEEMVSFLKENPSEFLIVSFKEEADPVRSTVSFTETLEEMLLQYPHVVNTSKEIPENVGDARGKLHIISRYEESSMGMPCYNDWTDNTSFVIENLYVQDHYKLSDSEEKIADITDTIEEAVTGEHGLVLNYTSCYFAGGFPPSYAGVPAHDINPWLLDYVRETEETAGVFVCDFITSELAQIMIGRNFS